jgi:5-methylcytosine-specific restriction protein A
MSGRWAKDMEKRTAMVLERDMGICWLCHKPGADTADHVVPRSTSRGMLLGPGVHDLWNLKAAHRSCNSRRGNRIALPRARVSRW